MTEGVRALLLRVLHLWFRLTRPMTLGVRAAVIDGQDRVLLVRHTYLPGWHLPGGGVEAGETVLDALRRELREEGQVEPTGPARLHGVFYNDRASRRDHVLVWEMRAFRVLGPKRPDREIAEAAFFPLAALPEGTGAATRARLAEMASGREPAERW